MRRSTRLLVVGAGALVLVVLVLAMNLGSFGDGGEALEPAALERIDAKNSNAAAEAAALQRLESAQTAEAADREAQRRDATVEGGAPVEPAVTRPEAPSQ
jgi:hypothetical protein